MPTTIAQRVTAGIEFLNARYPGAVADRIDVGLLAIEDSDFCPAAQAHGGMLGAAEGARWDRFALESHLSDNQLYLLGFYNEPDVDFADDAETVRGERGSLAKTLTAEWRRQIRAARTAPVAVA
jgi:hypothetical protein